MIPPWARGKLIRAAFLAGVAYQAGATLPEVERATWVALGETGAMPVVRDALKNRVIGGHRYADVSAWQVSLVHWMKNLLGFPQPEGRQRAEDITRNMLDVRQAVGPMLTRLRSLSPFNGEAGVRDGVGVSGKILREISDVIQVEVRRIDAAQYQDLSGIVLLE